MRQTDSVSSFRPTLGFPVITNFAVYVWLFAISSPVSPPGSKIAAERRYTAFRKLPASPESLPEESPVQV